MTASVDANLLQLLSVEPSVLDQTMCCLHGAKTEITVSTHMAALPAGTQSTAVLATTALDKKVRLWRSPQD